MGCCFKTDQKTVPSYPLRYGSLETMATCQAVITSGLPKLDRGSQGILDFKCLSKFLSFKLKTSRLTSQYFIHICENI